MESPVDSEDWKLIQQNVFTRWCNERLKVQKVSVEDIGNDFSDGVRLIILVQVLSEKKVGRYTKKPRIHAQKMENVQLSLDLLTKKEGIRLVNIGAGDIVNGNLKLILGLIWTLILKYQISVGFGMKTTDQKGQQLSAKDIVKDYVQDLVPHKKFTNFTTDWNDGILVASLVDAVAPGLCPEAYTMTPDNALKNAEIAMNRAEEWLGVPKLLLPEDMVNPHVDAHSVMTYVSQFPEAVLKDGAPLTKTGDASKVVVSGPGVGKEVPIGVKVPFFVNTIEAGVGPLNIDIIEGAGDGQALRAEVDYKDGVYTYKYEATVKGDISVRVRWCGDDVPGSKFSVSASPDAKLAPELAEVAMEVDGALESGAPLSAPPPPVVVSGKGLEEGFVDEWVEFEVDCSKAQSGGLGVAIDGPSKTESEMMQLENGKILVKYLPKVEGIYTLNVKFDDREVEGSPFKPKITKRSAVDENNKPVKVFELKQVQEGVKKGEDFDFKLKLPNADASTPVTSIVAGSYNGDDDIPAKLSSASFTLGDVHSLLVDKQTYTPELIFEDDGFKIKFHPETVGVYALLLFIGETPVKGTPYFFGVNDPTKVKLTGSGCGSEDEVFHIEKPLSWEADCTLAGPGTLRAFMFGPDDCKQEVEIKELPTKNTYSLSYTPDVAGSFKLAVTYGGHEVSDCPTLHVSDPSKASVAGVRYAIVGDEVPFKIDLKMAGSGTLGAQLKGPSEEPLSFKNNNDGTGTLSFVATEVGEYELEVKFGETPLSSAPLEVTVIDPAAVTVYGPGITGIGACVGKPAAVFVDTTKSGQAPVEVTFTAPDSEEITSVELVPLEENTAILKGFYTPKIVGKYKVTVTFATRPVEGSPFIASIANPDAVKLSLSGLMVVIPGEDCNIDCDIEKAGPGLLSVNIDGNPVDVKVKDIDDDHKQLAFAAPLEGVHEATVLYNGVPVSSPIKLMTGDPSKVKVSGPAVDSTVVAKEKTHFTVDTSDAGSGEIKPTITSPDGEEVPFTLTKSNEQCQVEYVPEVPGIYTISVLYSDQPVPQSPLSCNVIDPTAVTYALQTPEKAVVGEPVELVVDASKAGEGDLEVSVKGPEECPVYFTQNEEDVLKCLFTPTEPGIYEVPIAFEGLPISAEPLSINVTDIDKVEASGPGVTGKGLQVGQPAEVVVDTSKSGSAPVEAKLTKPSGEVDTIKLQPQDEDHPDILVACYTPEESGPYSLDVCFDDEPLSESPYALYVPNKEDVALTGPGLSEAVAGEPAIIDLFMKDVDLDDVAMQFSTPEGEEVPIDCKILPVDEDHCMIEYVPVEEATMFALPLYAGAPIGEKLSVSVASPVKCRASGPGISDKLTAGDETWFDVDSSEAGPGTLRVTVSTPGDTPVKIHTSEQSPGCDRVTYTPRVAGDYEINISYNDVDIPGSPFPVSVINPAAVAHDLSGPHQISLGETAEFKVDTTRAGEGKLGFAVEGPVDCPVEDCDNEDGTHTLALTPQAVGAYKLPITFADLPISEKPVMVNVTDINQVEASGPGVTGKGLQVGQPAEVVVDTSKSGSAPVEAKLTKPSGEVDTIKLQPQDKDHPDVLVACYTPEESGPYSLDVCFDDQPLSESPYALYVPNKEDVALTGPGLSEAVVGEPAIIDLFMKDVDLDDVDLQFSTPEGKDVPVTKKKIDDDHCQIEYIPQEECIMSALPLYAGAPIGNKLSIAVANPANCRVSGPGVEDKLVAGERTHFTIDTSNGGPAKPRVNVTTPSGFKLRHKIRKSKDGLYTVKYTPRKVGDHQVAVDCNKKPLTDSPYTVPVFNPRAVRSKLIGPSIADVNDKVRLSVDVSRAGDGELQVLVCGPEECSIAPESSTEDDAFTFAFQATTTGVYELPVMFGNLPTARKPVPVTLTDISKVVVSGSGVTGDGAQLGVKADIFIDTSESGPAPVVAWLTRPSKKPKKLRLKLKKDNPDILVGHYTPRTSGHYLVEVLFNNETLPQSPYRIFVGSVGDIRLGGLGTSEAALNNDNIIDLFCENVEEEKIAALFMTPDGEKLDIPVSVEKVAEDQCQIKYVPQEEAPLMAAVAYSGTPVGKKLPICVINPEKCVVTPASLPLAVGVEAAYIVDATETGKATLTGVAVMADGKEVKAEVEETKKDGVYKALVTPTCSGAAAVTLCYAGAKIGQSPYEVQVIDVSGVTVSGLGGEPLLVEETLPFSVDASAAIGAGELKAFAESEVEGCDVVLESKGDGQYAGSITSSYPAGHKLHIQYAGVDVPGSPFLCPFVRPPPDASKVIVTDIDTPREFLVDAREAGGSGVLEIAVYGAYSPAKMIQVEHHGDFTFKVSYDIPELVETTISVKWHGQHLNGSPFTVIFEDDEK